MELASSPREMPLPKDLRPKQVEVIRAFSQSRDVVAKLPTGYGKTRAGAGAYALLRNQNVVNRILWLVPRSNQADQAAEEIPLALKNDYGIDAHSIIVGENPIPALKGHRSSKIEVFVATVQSLIPQRSFATFCDLTSTGRWFLVVDEHHHFGNEGEWVKRLSQLPSVAYLAMSATPKRPDASDHFPEPTIVETYYNAAKTGCVKRLSLHAYEYTVDAVTVDGNVIQFSTSDIVREAGSESPEEIDRFIAERKMRWSPKYISPLVQFPFERLIDLRLKNIRAQMLIQAMSCSHAKMVCEQVEALVQGRASVDWVGTGPAGRPSDVNADVLRRFCPKKDKVTGQREWELDILVNVGMAGEGLDTTDVTEVVFLTPANITNSNLQTIGRGARIMRADATIKCHVNVDTKSPMGEYVGEHVMELFDEGVVVDEIRDSDGDTTPRDASDYTELPDEMQIVVVDVRLTDIKQEPMYQQVRGALPGLAPGITEEQADRAAEKAVRDYLSRGSNQSSILAQERQQVNAAVSKITGLYMRRIAETGARPDKAMPGDINRRIRQKLKAMFGPIDGATDDVLKQQYRWLKELERQILMEHALRGAPKWLL